MKPLVSVVMPVRNGGDFLAIAVKSILTQSYPVLELIIVNDHSTDDAIAGLVCDDPRLKVIDSDGQGVVMASNSGFKAASGEFIARMDADDISLPVRLQCQLDYLADHPEIVIAGCCVEIFSADGIREGFARYQRWLNSVTTPQSVHQQLFIESPLPNPGLMFRAGALRQLQGYLNREWAEDYDLLLRADAMGMKMGKPDQILLRWREHAARLTHSDPRYGREKFIQAKVFFLLHHRLPGRKFIIWGAGPTGRKLHDLIIAEGGVVEGFIEVHPRRIGGTKRGLPVWSMDKVSDLGKAFVLVAVGAAGVRGEITGFLNKHDKRVGQDYLFVA